MINFIIWIVIGGLLGWIASMIMRTDGQQGTFLNIIVGIYPTAVIEPIIMSCIMAAIIIRRI